MSFKPMITILGPTACGKTALACQVAADFNGEIISADSRQVYCGMDIGTGKDIQEYQVNEHKIPYHLIDIVKPGMEYNVYRYQQDFYKHYQDIQLRQKSVVLCGGSGMYIEAVLKGYKLFPVPENKILRKNLSQFSDEELISQLANFKNLHNHTDSSEHDRLIRALEIEHYYLLHPELAALSYSVPSLIFGLNGDRDLVRHRITLRLRERLEDGLVEEVERLLQQGVLPERLIRYGLEYKFVTFYLQGLLTKEELFSQLNIAIHQFSKRQMTWFRKMEREGFKIHWLDVAWSMERKMDEIKQKMVLK